MFKYRPDELSNTFLNITAPNSVGLSIGGGAYPNNINRSYGTIGVIDISGKYIASQTIVSGNNKLIYPSIVGINTYAPKTDNYVMDINGPIHLENNEISSTIITSFEIISADFCKKNSNIGIIVGPPNQFNILDSLNKFIHNSFITIDGGKSWKSTNIADLSSGGLNIANVNLLSSSIVLDPSNNDNFYIFTVGTAIDVSLNGDFYYSYNSGTTWNAITLQTSSSSTVIYTFNHINITNYSAYISTNDKYLSNGQFYIVSLVSFFNGDNNNRIKTISNKSTGSLFGKYVDTYYYHHKF